MLGTLADRLGIPVTVLKEHIPVKRASVPRQHYLLVLYHYQ